MGKGSAKARERAHVAKTAKSPADEPIEFRTKVRGELVRTMHDDGTPFEPIDPTHRTVDLGGPADDDSIDLNIRLLVKQLRQIEARADADKPKQNDISLAANIGRTLTLLRGEKRKDEAARKKAGEKLSLDEQIAGIKQLIEEMPAERRTDLVAWVVEHFGGRP